MPNSVSYDFRYMMSSLKSFISSVKAYLGKSKKNSSLTKTRNFEIPTQGGFQLTDFVPTLDEYFEIGKEVVCYNTVDEVEKLIKYYLINSSEREIIKEAGIVKARKKHTFKNRIIEFMRDIEKVYENQ